MNAGSLFIFIELRLSKRITNAVAERISPLPSPHLERHHDSQEQGSEFVEDDPHKTWVKTFSENPREGGVKHFRETPYSGIL